LQSKIKSVYPDIKIHFHILCDNENELNLKDEEYWSNLIDNKIENLYSYNKTFFDNYVEEYYGLDYKDKFKLWKPIYFILMAHYLRRVKLEHYYLIYDDDVLINDDFKHITDLLIERIPFGITEPANSGCDKVLFQKLVGLYGMDFQNVYRARNSKALGFNAGFQGMDLSIYDNFLSADRFELLLNIFEYQSIYDENGEEIWDNRRFFIDTQQQSFMGLMNTAISKKDIHILDPEKYFVVPNFGPHPKYGQLDPDDEPDGGWRWGLDSKITHFIGHTRGKGKPKQFLDMVDQYLIENKFM
jgi:hypothetical protein